MSSIEGISKLPEIDNAFTQTSKIPSFFGGFRNELLLAEFLAKLTSLILQSSIAKLFRRLQHENFSRVSSR